MENYLDIIGSYKWFYFHYFIRYGVYCSLLALFSLSCFPSIHVLSLYQIEDTFTDHEYTREVIMGTSEG